MKPIEIESWALRILEAVENHQTVEDSRVELKSEWIEPRKAARRLAGHANAARGENILWLVGVDEKQGVKGVAFHELSDWFAGVQSEFDGPVPFMRQQLNISFKGVTVAALLFDTDRAPYVVENPAYGATKGEAVAFEVPWREGTKVRTATRNDLILLLSPIVKKPTVEALSGKVWIYDQPDKSASVGSWSADVEIYVVPNNEMQVVFPFHKCKAEIAIAGGNPISVDEMFLTPLSKRIDRWQIQRLIRPRFQGLPQQVNVNPNGETIEATDSEIVIRGPGKVSVSAHFSFSIEAIKQAQALLLHVTLFDVVGSSEISLECKFANSETDQDGRFLWKFSNNQHNYASQTSQD